MKTKNWQTISLDFLKEIISEYYSDSETYKNKVIEIKTSESNPDRMFLDRITPERQGKSDFIKKFMNTIEENDLTSDPIESLVVSKMLEKNLVGAMVLLKKEDDADFIKFGKRLMEQAVDNLTEEERESMKKELSEINAFLDTYTPDRYFPIDKSNLESLLWEALIISVPPTEKINDSLKPPFDPIWFKKDTDVALQEQDWNLSLSERFAKIRSYEYEEFKEIIEKWGED